MPSITKRTARPGRAGPVPAPASRTLARAAAALLPALFAFALYLPSLGNPLVWDDDFHLPLARKMTVAETFGNAGGEYRRPVVLLSYMGQWKVGMASAAELHAVNVLLHGANSLLLALLLLRMGLPASVAGAAALVFAVHPLQSGSAAYISGRTDLLAAAFTLLALLLVAQGPDQDKHSRRGAPTGDHPFRELAAALACAACVALAALSKEIGLAAGPLVALFAYFQLRRGRHPSPLLPIAALVTCVCCALLVMPPAATAGGLSLSLRLRAVGTAAATYTQLLVWPVGLHLDRLSPTRGHQAIFTALTLTGLAAAVVIRFVRTPTLVGLGLVSALVLYLPGSGFIPVSPAIAERFIFTPEQFLYLPLAPLCALLAAALHRYGGHPATLVGACLLALLSVPSVLAHQRDFAGDERLYRSTLKYSPSPRACFNLGRLQLDTQRYQEAASTYKRCVDFSPGDAGAHGQLAIAYQKLGRAAEARASYLRATELDDDNPLLWSNFATLDANEARYGDARTKWQRALAIDPAFAPAQAALAKLEQATK